MLNQSEIKLGNVEIFSYICIIIENYKTEKRVELVLNDGKNLKQARRALRRCGLRLAVRGGRIYTIKVKETTQPRTEKQKKNWQIMAEANRMADAELRREGGKEEWEKRARETGYKTARGCVRAYFIKKIKEKMEIKERNMEEREIKNKTKPATNREKERRNEKNEKRWIPDKTARSRIKKKQKERKETRSRRPDASYRYRQDAISA